LHKLCCGCPPKKEGKGRFCWLAELSALAVQGFNGKSRWRLPAEEKAESSHLGWRGKVGEKRAGKADSNGKRQRGKSRI